MGERLKVYHYDRYFCFVRESEIEGMRDGFGRYHFDLPLNTTLNEPPEEAGKVAVLDPDTRQWSLLANHRGERWWSHRGEEVIVERPGDPHDFGLYPEWFVLSSRGQ